MSGSDMVGVVWKIDRVSRSGMVRGVWRIGGLSRGNMARGVWRVVARVERRRITAKVRRTGHFCSVGGARGEQLDVLG